MFEWIREYIQNHGVRGIAGYVVFISIFIFLFTLLVRRRTAFGEDMEVVTYYRGYPKLKNTMIQGRLRIQNDNICFLAFNEEKLYFSIPLIWVKEIKTENRERNLFETICFSGHDAFVGWIQYLFISYVDDTQKEYMLQFGFRTKSNKAAYLEKLILEAKHTSSLTRILQ